MRNYLRGLAFGLVVVVSLMVSKPAYALVNQTFPNFAGVTTAVARHDVWIVNSTSWNAHIRSFTQGPAYNSAQSAGRGGPFETPAMASLWTMRSNPARCHMARI